MRCGATTTITDAPCEDLRIGSPSGQHRTMRRRSAWTEREINNVPTHVIHLAQTVYKHV